MYSHLLLSGTSSTSIWCDHGGWLLKGSLKLLVCLLLNCLSVLQLLDQFHLELLHLHDFLFLHVAKSILVVDARIVMLLDCCESAVTIFFDLHCCKALLVGDDLILHAVLLPI